MEAAWTNEQLVEMVGSDRIDQIAFITGCLARSLCNHPEGDGYIINFDTLRKFAESIVQECANVNHNSPFQDGEFHAREVLEHFGVEQ